MTWTTGAQWGLPPVIEAPVWWATLVVAILAVFFVTELLYGLRLIVRRDEDALLFWLVMLGSVTVYPYFVEPWIDVIGATTYMTNFLPYVTIADRPLPIFVLGVWGGGTAMATVWTYRLMKRGVPASLLVTGAVAFGVVECIGEMLNSHFGLMLYYSNNALVFGVPMPSLVQNGGWIVLSAWAYAVVVPQLHGWRWAVIPFVSPAVYLAYTVVCTAPSYFAIHTGLGPGPSWPLAVLSTSLNLLVVAAAAYSPTLQRLRDDAASRPASRSDLATTPGTGAAQEFESTAGSSR